MIRENMWRALAAASACLLLIGLGSPTVSAAAEEGFRLRFEPLDLSVLEKDVDTNSSKFQEYRDLKSGFRPSLKLFGESADGERNLALRLSSIGRDDARYTLNYRLEGKYALTFDYNKIPHRFGNDATLLWDQPAVNRFELPDPVQQLVLDAILAQREAGGSVDFAFLDPLLEPFFATANQIDLGLQRDRIRARYDLGKMGRMAWAFEYTHENREGNRPIAGSFGFNNVQEIPEPIDYDTTGAEIAGEFNGDQGGVRFGYRYSAFENNNDVVIWDNIFRSFDSTNSIAYLGPNSTPEGPSRGRTLLPPDNEANLLFVDGRARVGNWWLNGNVVYNTMTQDDPLIPYTINTAIEGEDERTGATFNAATQGLPVSRADTEVDVLNFSANAGTDFGEDWSLTLRYRYYDYDNGSPRIEFPGYVRLDAVWEPPALLTVPYSYTRDNLGAELGWEATDTTRLSLSYMLESWDREFREIEESDEDIFKLSLNSRPSDKVTVRASWAIGDRTTSEYDVEAQEVFFVFPEGINNQPGLRKYDEAVRDVDDYEVAVQFYPSSAWNFSFGFSGREEDYPESEFGLVFDDLTAYNFELGYTPGANLNFYLFGHVADREVFQRARQSGGTLSTNPLDNWSVLLNEDTTTWGLGLNSTTETGWSWDLAANLSDSDGEGDFETPPGGSPSEAVDFNNYEDIELFSVWLKVFYDIGDTAAVGFFYLYEDYTIDSFILQGLEPYLPQSILLAANDGDYQANLFGVSLRFVF